MSEGTVDNPRNKRIAVLLRIFLQNYTGDRDTVVMMALKACVRYGKKVRVMTKAQVVNLVGSIYDSITNEND